MWYRRSIYFCLLLCLSLCTAELHDISKIKKEDKSKQTQEDPENDILYTDYDPDSDLDLDMLVEDKGLLDLNLDTLPPDVRNQLHKLRELWKKRAIMESMRNQLKYKVEALDQAAERKLAEKKAENSEDPTESSKNIVEELKPSWFETVVDLPHDQSESTDENPQELLDQLPPVDEESKEPLTPEQEEARQLYESAMRQLSRRSPDVGDAVRTLALAAERGDARAIVRLAWARLFGEGGPVDVDAARETFQTLADAGNPDAQHGLGFLYASGIGVAVSQPRALVLYTLAAAGGNTGAQMSLAYRYWSGATVAPNCEKALHLYRKVATKVASEVTFSGGPAIQRVHLLEEQDNAGMAPGTLDNDLIEYYQLLADKGDIQAQVGLGQLHYQGGRGVTLDIQKALQYFTAASKAGNAVAHAFLGKIYLEGGDGIEPDNKTALEYFKKAAELNNPVGQSGLGLMYLEGRGVERDTHAALKYFTLAANQGWVDGQLHLANMYFSGTGVRRDFKLANKYYSLASQSGHVLALYHLGQMHAQGLGVLRSCTTAVELYKNVCERGAWGARLMSAHAAHRAARPDAAFTQYSAAAELGYEVAQSNAAYLLDRGEVTLFDSEEERYVRALALWGRAAAQGYSPARVKLGDYHYYGLGTRVDYEAAANHYRTASELQRNAQATFNLGYMHERGLGLARDSHLAKRCYDLAAETAPEARLPVALALVKLNIALSLDAVADYMTGWTAAAWLSESGARGDWDVWLITLLLGALGIVLYLRRPRAAPAP